MVEIKNLEKQYKGKCALDHISFVLDKQIVGLLGPNGAGKTTLMRILSGVEKETRGTVIYKKHDGKICALHEYQMGYLPQNFGLIKNYTLYEHMQYFACLKGIDKTCWKSEIEKVLSLVCLNSMAGVKCKKLSGGMVRRAGIAQALLGEPQLILFDEPTVGLDPEERMRFHDIIKNLKCDCTVMISTHIIEDIDKMCSDVIVMKEGKMLYYGKTEGLKLRGIDSYLNLLKGDYMAGEMDEE